VFKLLVFLTNVLGGGEIKRLSLKKKIPFSYAEKGIAVCYFIDCAYCKLILSVCVPVAVCMRRW
jgi:hypothetical protein